MSKDLDQTSAVSQDQQKMGVFEPKFKKLLDTLLNLENVKYQPPWFSSAFTPLASFFKIPIENKDSMIDINSKDSDSSYSKQTWRNLSKDHNEMSLFEVVEEDTPTWSKSTQLKQYPTAKKAKEIHMTFYKNW